VLPANALSGAYLRKLAQSQPALVGLCAYTGGHIRYALKRLRRVPSACIVVAAFAKEHAVPEVSDTSLADHVQTTLRGAGKACIDEAALGEKQSRIS
jgi:uncharacterized protein with ACT and thioredoxin-like domain